jgi:LacI family gluconate utilization system Gnt-I transcriptional repressor
MDTKARRRPLDQTGSRHGRRGTGKLRLTDIAKLAGVAPITVSRVINTPDSVSPETLRRVRQVIDRAGYVPNLLAGGLASARSRLVAGIFPTMSSPVFQETVEALTSTLATAGYQLMLGQSGYADSREDALLEAIVARRPDGIVLTGILRSVAARMRLLASGIPVVETWDLTPTPVDMVVGFSHEKIGAAVADYFHSSGRRSLAVVTAADERARLRAKGLVDAATRLRIGYGPGTELPIFVAPAPGTLGSGRRGLADLLERQPNVDAIFCSSDMLALGVMTEAQARGIPIPDRIAVVGYGDLNFAADALPPLTSVRVNGAIIGETAARWIIERARGGSVAQRVVDVGFSIVKRESA